MVDLAILVLVVAGLLVVVSLMQPLAARLAIPHTVLLAAVGVAIGVGSALVLRASPSDAVDTVAAAIVGLPITSQTFLLIFLPVLIFQTSLTIDVRRMAEDAAPILLLAIVAVLVATFLIGAALAPLTGVSLTACLLLGAIVATTDPSAVVGVFRDIGAPARLTRLVEGESLLNDATAIALFVLLLQLLILGQEPNATEAAWTFVRGFAGGVAVGFVGARLMVAALPVLRDLPLAEVTFTVALPYLVFALSERYFHVSGVVAAVTAGLVVSAIGRARVSPETWDFLHDVWEQLAFWASSLVFILAAILVPRLLTSVSLWDLLALVVLVAAALVARALVLFGLLPLLSAAGLSERVSHRYKLVILWGGLRGAVTLALALSVTENRALDPEIKRFVAVLATGFVLFTLFVNGTTLRPMIRRLGLDRLSPIDRVLRDKALALALGNVKDAIRALAHEYRISPALAREAVRPSGARAAAAEAEGDVEERIADRDRITIGLVALANRERELILEHYEQRTVSRNIVELLLADVGRLMDQARTSGRTGYNRAAQQRVGFRPSFRFAHRLQRHLGITGPLAGRVADRFERLLVTRLVLEELRGFADSKLRTVLGARVAEILGEILSRRVEATGRALEALRLQYPEYADTLERRFLRRSALRLEEAEYRTLLEEGLIGPELYGALRRDLQKAWAQVEARPRLDLGLDTRELVSHFPLFADFDAAQLDEVCRLLRSRFAVPGERLVRRGERGDAMYFISSGAVEVTVGDRKVRLGRGDFFGEMALLGGRLRVADVMALGYCRLLALYRPDFRAFLSTHPEIRAKIREIAEARRRANAAGARAAS